MNKRIWQNAFQPHGILYLRYNNVQLPLIHKIVTLTPLFVFLEATIKQIWGLQTVRQQNIHISNKDICLHVNYN